MAVLRAADDEEAPMVPGDWREFRAKMIMKTGESSCNTGYVGEDWNYWVYHVFAGFALHRATGRLWLIHTMCIIVFVLP